VLLLIVDILFYAIAILSAVPAVMLLLESVASLLPGRRARLDTRSPRPTVAVLIPAHDEEGALSVTIESVKRDLADRDRIIVIADNCNDKTADVARLLGAEVLERHDEANRGKGFALAHGVSYLHKLPPQVVIVLDADMTVEPGTIEALARTSVSTGRPAQAIDLLEPPSDSTRDRVSSLAFTFKNLVRPLGLKRLGLPCLLMGTGMALPWSLIRKAELASGNIVEDMELGLGLAMAGYAPIFCTDAKVTGHLPRQEDAARSQRTRWEHGHLSLMLRQAPRMIFTGLFTLRPTILAIGLDLAIPPLSFMVVLLLCVSALTIASGLTGGPWTPAIIAAGSLLAVPVSVFLGWAKHARHTMPLMTLLAAPLYVLWKIPIYLMFLVRRETNWVRTARDIHETPSP